LIYSNLLTKDIHASATFAMSASVVALMHQRAVNPEISVELINEIEQKYFKQ
jgi:hypothetical protein